MADLLQSAIDALANQEVVTLATVVGPAELPAGLLGRKLLLRSSGEVEGSLGAAAVDQQVVGTAHAVAISPPSARLERYRLTADEAEPLGVAPGLELQVFVEAMAPPEMLLIAGGGRIAQPLARLGKLLGFTVAVVDDRAEFASQARFPEANRVVVGDYKEVLASFAKTPSTYVVIVTRGHLQDEAALRQVIESPAAYVGMIGSQRKVRDVLGRMAAQGVGEEAIARVFSPIGLDIGAETPEEIAVGIMAEIINVRRLRKPHPVSLSVLRRLAGRALGSSAGLPGEAAAGS